MRIALAADHAGFELKEKLKKFLEGLKHEVKDFGARQFDEADDYPDFIIPAAQAVGSGTCERAIVIGGTGQGEAMAANKIKGARAAVYYGGGARILVLSREHNDANVLSLGARFMTPEQAQEAVRLWLATQFSKEERHARRIKKFDKKS